LECSVYGRLDATPLSPHAPLPTGQVFYSGPTGTSAIFDPSSSSWDLNIARTIFLDRTYGTSVLLPLRPSNNYDPKVMILGGSNPATNTTEIIDLGAATPQWTSGPNMSQARVEMNAVILPTGKVLALGGSAFDEDATSLSLNADLYDPVSNTFALGRGELISTHVSLGGAVAAGCDRVDGG